MSKRRYHYVALAVGLVAFAAAGLIYADRNFMHLGMPGGMNTGHEDLSCADCHRPEVGSARQQLQAQVDYWLGERKDWIHFQTVPVDNDVCLDCHARPDDRHPVYRFREPRFREARVATGADQCVACHDEHHGVRVTQEASFCSACHADTKIKNDPIDVPHATLFKEQRWDTCLTCHDFHGNHKFETPSAMADAFPPEAVADYLNGRAGLYSDQLRWPAKRPGENP